MGWEDRQYYRDRSGSPGLNALRSIFGGSVPLFTAFGIKVRVHATLIFLIASVILLDFAKGFPLRDRIISMAALGIIILLHEFGHCFAARSVGGDAREILLWPLGGLASADSPHRPWPRFVTVAGGPLVNVVICIACGIIVWSVGGGAVSLNPFQYIQPAALDQVYHHHHAYFWIGAYSYWLFRMSYLLFLFNLLPIFPLDGGQAFQCMLWPKLGYYRATHIACIVGMGGSVGLGIFGILDGFSFLLIAIAISCFFYCRNRLYILKETGGEDFLSNDGPDYSSSLRPDAPPKKRRRRNTRAMRRLRKQAQREAAEQERIDTILAKVSAQGIHSLTWSERRALKRATDRQRQHELELSRNDSN